MSKFPLLEQLRDDIAIKEEAIKAPVIEKLNYERREKETAVKKYQEIEFKLGEDIIRNAMELAKREIALHLYKELPKALGTDGTFTFTVTNDMLRMLNPDKILQLLIEEYKHQSRPRLSINFNQEQYYETIYIKIPELNLRLNVTK